jgi:hypothetical protein
VIFETSLSFGSSAKAVHNHSALPRAAKAALFGLLILALFSDFALAQRSLEYGPRGNRWEGVRALPVSGYAIELLSFRVRYEEPVPSGRIPGHYRVRFPLDRDAPAYLVIREIDNKHSYWLDHVNPETAWSPGFNNIFEWPTADVLAYISDVKLYDLGVIVRVSDPNPRSIERVAPAILYYSTSPTSVSGYEFAFKSNATVSLQFTIESGDGRLAKSQPVPPTLRKWSYDVPFSVKWDASNAPPGKYRLKVNARVLENNDKLVQEVEFVHQPKIR